MFYMVSNREYIVGGEKHNHERTIAVSICTRSIFRKARFDFE